MSFSKLDYLPTDLKEIQREGRKKLYLAIIC